MRIPIRSDTESPDPEVILAAGGVIERHTEDGVRIAVIRRERYGKEWCLPKGKVNEGETLTDAALREIDEETGCKVSLVRFLTADVYPAKDNVKAVFYWICHLQSDECDFQPNSEVKDLAWLRPEEAVLRLTHPSQQKLIRDQYQEKQPPKLSIIEKLAYIYSRYFQAKRWNRLASSIPAYREEFSCLTRTQNIADFGCEANLHQLLDQAESALTRGDIDRGWKCFHAARRIELLLVQDKTLMLAKGAQIRDESDKLNKWRKEAVNNLLPKNMKPEEITPGILFDAASIRDEHFVNQAYKSSLKRTHHFVLGSLLVLILLWICYGLNQSLFNFDNNYADIFPSMYPGLITFGLLGATISAILKAVKTEDASTRIPEITLAIRVTLLRIVLGAAAAIVAYLLLMSDFKGMLSKLIPEDIRDMEIMTIYVVAFASGFTERLVLGVVEKITK